MNKKKLITAFAMVILIVALGVGATMALLMASSRPVVNTFTVGNVQITLSETSGEKYQLLPGTVVEKNPTLTVQANSDDCWLFFRMEASETLGDYVTYMVAEGWTALPGAAGVYYRQVESAQEAQVFFILENNQVQVLDTVTEEQLEQLTEALKLKFTGYAVQKSGIATAAEAWQQFLGEEVTGD